MGIREERVLLYQMVQRVWRTRAGPKNVFQGYVKNTNHFRWELKQFKKWYDIDEDLSEAFADRLRESEGLHETYADLCQRFRRSRPRVPGNDRWRQIEFIGGLRSTLAEVCVDALEPDLVILDEFQRFKDLLDGEHATAKLAKQLFTYSDDTSDVRLLLLSATPYKMYTLPTSGPRTTTTRTSCAPSNSWISGSRKAAISGGSWMTTDRRCTGSSQGRKTSCGSRERSRHTCGGSCRGRSGCAPPTTRRE